MFKLMKYELKKQMFSKIIMAMILIVMIILFTVSTIKGWEKGSIAAIVFMAIAMLIAVFYSAVECMDVYDKDLKTKQSYMLFMVPQSAKSILGAKMLSAIVQVFLTMLAFGAAIVACISAYLVKNMGFKSIFEVFMRMVEELFEIEINIWTVVDSFAVTLIFWVFVVMLYMFINTLSNTILTQRKLISFVTTIIYIALFAGVFWLEYQIFNLNLPEHISDILSYVYWIAIDFALFFGTAWLIDKKLSV